MGSGPESGTEAVEMTAAAAASDLMARRNSGAGGAVDDMGRRIFVDAATGEEFVVTAVRWRCPSNLMWPLLLPIQALILIC